MDRSVIFRVICLAIVGGILISATPFSSASQFRVLYAFNGAAAADGSTPYSNLVTDSAGNLYGTTPGGGVYKYGSVYKVSPDRSGGWTESVLHSFNHDLNDGIQPIAGVVVDTAGNLYGTTSHGGAYENGTVFKLSPAQDGTWVETILHAFDGNDGGVPIGDMILDKRGNLFGTTFGAPYTCGTVFELAPNTDGTWKHAVLHNFGRIRHAPGNGCQPQAGLSLDASGNLYGTTNTGGANIYFGTVFELTYDPSGHWAETVLHSFGSNIFDGAYPADRVVFDKAGNLYGTAFAGGYPRCLGGCGIVFELSPATSGEWLETILHSFTGGEDGAEPYGGLIVDPAGNLYGTTSFGGSLCANGCGVLFKLTLGINNKWTETALHRFDVTDGAFPQSTLLRDAKGNLYGTTQSGGNTNWSCPGGCGNVFEVTP